MAMSNFVSALLLVGANHCANGFSDGAKAARSRADDVEWASRRLTHTRMWSPCTPKFEAQYACEYAYDPVAYSHSAPTSHWTEAYADSATIDWYPNAGRCTASTEVGENANSDNVHNSTGGSLDPMPSPEACVDWCQAANPEEFYVAGYLMGEGVCICYRACPTTEFAETPDYWSLVAPKASNFVVPNARVPYSGPWTPLDDADCEVDNCLRFTGLPGPEVFFGGWQGQIRQVVASPVFNITTWTGCEDLDAQDCVNIGLELGQNPEGPCFDLAKRAGSCLAFNSIGCGGAEDTLCAVEGEATPSPTDDSDGASRLVVGAAAAVAAAALLL